MVKTAVTAKARVAMLAMKAEDFAKMGKTPPAVLKKKEGQTYGEAMASSKKLTVFLRQGEAEARRLHTLARQPKCHPRDREEFVLFRDNVFLPNIEYLEKNEILPEEFSRIDWKKELALPH